MREETGSSIDPEVPHLAVPEVLDTPEAGRRVMRGGALRVVGFVAGVGASALGVAMVTRHLGASDYGRFQTVIALVTIVYSVTDLGMTTLGMREYAQRDGAERQQFMRTLLGLRLALTCFGVGLACAVAALLGYDSQMVAGAGVMGVGLMIGVVAATLSTPLAAEIRMGVVTGLDLGRQVLTTLGYVALVLAGAGIVPFLAVVIPVNVLLLTATIPLVRGKIPLRPSFDLGEWVALIKPTLTFALATTTGMIYLYTALVLTSLVASKLETGLFAASFRVFAIVAAVPGILVSTAFPLLSRAARDDRERLRYAAQRLFEGTAVLGGAALVGGLLAAEPVIQVIAGEKYLGAVDALRIQSVALASTFVIAVWGFTLLALHAHRAMIVVNTLAMTVSAVTVLVLADRYGATGAAVGTLLGELTLAIGYLTALVRRDPMMRPSVARVARVLPGILLGLAAWLLPVPAAVAAVVGLTTYGLAVFALGAVPAEVREHLPGPIARFGLEGPST